MAPQQPSQPRPPTPAMFLQRLTIVTIALIAAQVLYAMVAIAMLQGGFKAPKRAEPGGPLIVAIFVLGMLGAMVSFPLVKGFARRQPDGADFTTVARALLKQFFAGFALSEIAGLAGLLIFFVYADLKTLFFLLWVAATSIAAHFLRVKKAVEDFEDT